MTTLHRMKQFLQSVTKLSIKEDKDDLCSAILKDLQNNEFKLADLAEGLEPYISDEHGKGARGSAAHLFVAILAKIPPNFLNSLEIKKVAEMLYFFMRVHHSLLPLALNGILSLVKMDNLTDEAAANIMSTLNSELICQSLNYSERRVIYEIIFSLSKVKEGEMKKRNIDYVSWLLTCMNGERHPDVLLYLFRHLAFILKSFPLEHLTGEAFNILSSYFPVDYQSKSDDPRKVTRNDLARSLLGCLMSCEAFVPYNVELALEKLTSNLDAAKIDSLVLLKSCFEVFPFVDFGVPLKDIHSALLAQVNFGGDTRMLHLISDAYAQFLAAALSHIQMKDDRFLEMKAILKDLFLKLHKYLESLQLKYFLPCVQFLVSVSSSSKLSMDFIIFSLIPAVLNLKFHSTNDIVLSLEAMTVALAPLTQNFTLEDLESWKSNLRDAIQRYFHYSDHGHIEVRIRSIRGLTVVGKCLSLEERNRFLELVFYRIKSCPLESEREECLKSLKILSLPYGKQVEKILNQELAQLQMNLDSTSMMLFSQRILKTLCALATNENFLEYFVTTIKIFVAEPAYVTFTIKCLRQLVECEEGNEQFLKHLHKSAYLPDFLVGWWMDLTGEWATDESAIASFSNFNTCRNLTIILTLIIRTLDAQQQMEICHKYASKLLPQDADKKVRRQKWILWSALLQGIICGMRREIIYCVAPLAASLIDILTNENHVNGVEGTSETAVAICLASIFNKIPPASMPNMDEFALKIANVNSLTTFVYVLKGLLLRGHKDLNVFLDPLMAWLRDEEKGLGAAGAFKMLVDEDEYFLNEKCYCEIKLLYKQRLLYLTMDKLCEMAKSSEELVKRNCSMAILNQLHSMPNAVLNNYLTRVVPLLADSLELDHSNNAPALDILSQFLKKREHCLLSCVSTFIPVLLNLSLQSPTMNNCVKALDCLFYYSKYDTVDILPFKQKVIYGLIPCLSHRKRFVRKAAVRARMYWFAVGL